MKNWSKVKVELLKKPGVKKEYDRLTPKYNMISQLIEIRNKEGLTQAELASKIGTKQSAISRIESGNMNVSIGLLEKIAEALGKQLYFEFK